MITSREAGLSLMEVMVALTLIALIFFSVDFAVDENKSNILQASEDIQRAVRFANQETILRGVVIRVRIDLDAVPQEWTVEFGPDGEFTLPSLQTLNEESEKDPSLANAEARKKEMDKINKLFNRIDEYQEESVGFPENVKILGVATNKYSDLIRNGEVSIYIYPSGERDAALVIFGDEQRVAALTIHPFQDEMEEEFITLTSMAAASANGGAKGSDPEQTLDEQDRILADLYKKWLGLKM